jgi:hypothetical protein
MGDGDPGSFQIPVFSNLAIAVPFWILDLRAALRQQPSSLIKIEDSRTAGSNG